MVFAPWSCHRTRLAARISSLVPPDRHPTIREADGRFIRQHRHLLGFPKAAPSARVEPSRRDTRGASTGTCFALHRSAVPVGCIARGASRRRPMQTLRRTVGLLIFPAIAYLGAACERTDTPTGVPPKPVMQMADPAPSRTWTNDFENPGDDTPAGDWFVFLPPAGVSS